MAAAIELCSAEDCNDQKRTPRLYHSSGQEHGALFPRLPKHCSATGRQAECAYLGEENLIFSFDGDWFRSVNHLFFVRLLRTFRVPGPQPVSSQLDVGSTRKAHKKLIFLR